MSGLGLPEHQPGHGAASLYGDFAGAGNGGLDFSAISRTYGKKGFSHEDTEMAARAAGLPR